MSAEPEEVWIGDTLVAFDGRVVEVFGFRGSESLRFHVRNLDLEVGEPDRKARRALTLKPASRGSGGCMFEVEEDDWQQVGPLVDRIYEGIPDPD